MNLPLTQTPGGDIYDLGFDRGLNRTIPDEATGVVYDSINDTQNTASLLSGGNLNLKTLSIGGLVRQVAPGDDIQAAIDAVSREGGGTVQLLAKTYLLLSSLNLKSGVAIVGAGRGQTVLDFQSTNSSISAVSVNNFAVKDLTVQNTTNSGILASSGGAFIVDNVLVQQALNGVHVYGCDNGVVSNCVTFDCTNGYLLDDAGTFSAILTLDNCLAQANTYGFSYTGSSSLVINTKACVSVSNTSHGFFVQGSTAVISSFNGCFAIFNAGYGFHIANGLSTITGCVSIENTLGDIYADSTGPSLSAITGNFFPLNMGLAADLTSQVMGNYGEEISDYNRIAGATNKSGGTIPAGAVVIFASTSSPNDVTTSSTNGSPRVVGMNVGASNANGSMLILREGLTNKLLATNGASSISVGDFLSTYSNAYFAKKAVAGDTVFAFALEAPTTGTAIIDALLIPPRLI